MASVAIFFIAGFVFIAILFVISLILSPFTKILCKKIYYSLVVVPLHNDIEKEKPLHKVILLGMLLLPSLFLAWIIFITFYL